MSMFERQGIQVIELAAQTESAPHGGARDLFRVKETQVVRTRKTP